MDHPVAPSVTQADINMAIVGETFTVLPNGRTTICQLTLDNGFTVEGKSACVRIENFNAERGNKLAREDAVQKVWQLLGFRLADQLAHGEVTDAALSVAEAVEEPAVIDPIKVGDQVWFYERVGDQESAPMLALVAGIPKEGWVALTVFANNGTAHARETVVMLYPWMTTPDLPYYARLKFN